MVSSQAYDTLSTSSMKSTSKNNRAIKISSLLKIDGEATGNLASLLSQNQQTIAYSNDALIIEQLRAQIDDAAMEQESMKSEIQRLKGQVKVRDNELDRLARSESDMGSSIHSQSSKLEHLLSADVSNK